MSAHPKDPVPRNYAIGDFAKKTGVSTHFLKFYEEKGVLHPKVQSNGYRYYDIRDASLVLECRRMKNMGLSVKEIEKAINDSTPAETEQLLAQQQNVLEEQLWQQQMHLQGLQNLRAALRFCQQQEWSVRTAPDVWFLPHTMDREFLQEEGIYGQRCRWDICGSGSCFPLWTYCISSFGRCIVFCAAKIFLFRLDLVQFRVSDLVAFFFRMPGHTHNPRGARILCHSPRSRTGSAAPENRDGMGRSTVRMYRRAPWAHSGR